MDYGLRLDSDDFVMQRASAPKDVYCKEIEEAGFECLETNDVPTIKDNFLRGIPANRKQGPIANDCYNPEHCFRMKGIVP